MELTDPSGRVVAPSDLGWPEWRVAVAFEGRQHTHHGRFSRDVDRHSLMAADGWLVVRPSAVHLCRSYVGAELVTRALHGRGAVRRGD